MTDPKIDSILDEGNRLFLQGKLQDAIIYYDKILNENPQHVSSLNNKGYALSKLKDFENAIKCYDIALENSPDDLSLLVNKISSFRKQKNLQMRYPYVMAYWIIIQNITLHCIIKSEFYFL